VVLWVMGRLDEVGDVEWHLVDLGVVELLNLSEHFGVLGGDKVDSNTLSAESTTSTDSVDVVLLGSGEIVVDDKGDLLDVDTSRKQVGGNENSGRSGSELLHDDLSLTLVHVTVHGGDGELSLVELLGEPVDLSPGRAEDDGLGDGDSLVQVTQGVELPVLLLNGDEELPDTLKGELVSLDEDSDGVPHELLGDLENVLWHGGGEQHDLGLGREELEDVVDGILESGGEHLIGLVKTEHLDGVGLEGTSVDHVEHSAWGTDHDVGSLLELGHVLSDGGSTDTSVAVDIEVVSESDDDLLNLLGELSSWGEDQSLGLLDRGVNSLQNRDREGGGLSGTGLSLGDTVTSSDDGHDSSLLDGRGSLETVGVDTSEEVGLQLHVVEVVGDLSPVGLDLLSFKFEVIALWFNVGHDCFSCF